MAGIVWLASYPKSGNTWMRAFLANYITDAKSPVAINTLPDYGLGDSRNDCFERFAERPLSELSRGEIASLRPKVQDWFARSQAGQVFVKTHNMIGRVNGYPLISRASSAAAIYVARNPLDVAHSFAHHFQTPLDRAIATINRKNAYLPGDDNNVAQHIGSWSQNVRSWVNAPGMLVTVVRYEDMLADPVETFGSVVRFLELPLESERLERAIGFTSFEELRKQESAERFVEGHPDGRSFFREGKAGGWRERLSEDQAAQILATHGALMRRFGYLAQTDEPT